MIGLTEKASMRQRDTEVLATRESGGWRVRVEDEGEEGILWPGVEFLSAEAVRRSGLDTSDELEDCWKS